MARTFVWIFIQLRLSQELTGLAAGPTDTPEVKEFEETFKDLGR